MSPRRRSVGICPCRTRTATPRPSEQGVRLPRLLPREPRPVADRENGSGQPAGNALRPAHRGDDQRDRLRSILISSFLFWRGDGAGHVEDGTDDSAPEIAIEENDTAA